MPLGTLDRTPPPFFNQGPSALSKLLVLSALAVLLMVFDARLKLAGPVRSIIATALYPAQWLIMQPVGAARVVGDYLGGLQAARRQADEAERLLARQAQRAGLVEQLAMENRQLRELLSMRERASVEGLGAQVLFETADAYARRVVIDRGELHGVRAGAPVLDGHGVLGQVVRVYPNTAEVSLLIDGEQVIPVLNTRNGNRYLAYGLPLEGDGRLELRFVASQADIQDGDILSTSGVDGVYPPGVPVARVLSVERRTRSVFARVVCEPEARMRGALQVLVLPPAAPQVPGTPSVPKEAAT